MDIILFLAIVYYFIGLVVAKKHIDWLWFNQDSDEEVNIWTVMSSYWLILKWPRILYDKFKHGDEW